jgi:hypothetical protein
MMEWLILCLLVPAVLVPVVLLFGFVGCDRVFGLEDVHPTPPITTFELDSENNFHSSTATNQSGLEGSCFVVRITSSLLSTGGSTVWITVRGSTDADVQIDRVYISQAADSVDTSRDPFDPLDTDLTPVVDDGVGILVPMGQSVKLPIGENELRYHLDPDKDLLIAFDISASPGLGNLRYVQFPDVTAPFTYFKLRATPQDPPIQEAAVPDRTGFSPSLSPDGLRVFLYLIEKIQVRA